MKRSLYLIIGLVAFSCKKEAAATSIPVKENKLAKAHWLIGNWENKATEGTLLESWETKNDSTLMASSFFIKDKDTLFAEQIELQQRDGLLYYVPTVSDQNDGKSVTFTLTSLKPNGFVAENPKHDFPQKITYKLVGKDSLFAKISGLKSGKPHSETFKMVRNPK